MSRNLFWLSDDGKERVDDRRVISGILHLLKRGCRWCDCAYHQFDYIGAMIYMAILCNSGGIHP
jgi:hypothetical protein